MINRNSKSVVKDLLHKEMRKALLKLAIMHKIHEGEIYPYALIKSIEASHFYKRIGAATSEGIKNDVYNTINALEKSGYILMSRKVERGRTKKYYALTPQGKKIIGDARKVFIKAIKALSKMV